MPSGPAFRLLRRPLDWQIRPEDALSLLRSDTYPVALLGAWTGGSDILASEPLQVRCPPQSLADVLDVSWPAASTPAGGGRRRDDNAAAGTGHAFGGGWIGYLGFGAASESLTVPPAPGQPRQLPPWWFGYYDHVLRRERETGQWVFEALWTADRADTLERRFEDLSRRPRAASPGAGSYSCGAFRLMPSADEHRSAVRRAIDYIRQGDIFQANICLRLEAGFSGDPLDAFCRAAPRLDPPFAAFLRVPGGAVASLSPELFLRRNGTTVVTRPIKGTRHRPADGAAARQQREMLLASAKDRAENVMIVDLMRNDLSRVCIPGSVQVSRLLAAEAHPGVWHLVSDVQGMLAAGKSDGDLVAAAFPPGSVTGAPKVRAVEIIHELEASPREVYTGAIGYRSPLAGLELNVGIRTFEFHGGRAWLGSGGGITASSDAENEYRECLLKAAPLIRAMDAGIDESGSAHSAESWSGRLPFPASMRPRPAAGVFTSLRVTNGRVYDLGSHLARLEDSTRRLYGKHLPPDLHAELDACLSDRPSGRLRITARPRGGPLQVTAEVVAAGLPPDMVTLLPVTIPGGLGAHKWHDRRLLAVITEAASAGPGEHLLIQDRDEHILETDRANIFAVIDGVLHTPAADGRLLPGITRAAVLRAANMQGIAISAPQMTRTELLRASEVFVTNALHGVVPVRTITGSAAAWETGPVTSRMAALLASRPATPSPTGDRGPRTSRPHAVARGRGTSPRRPVVVVIDNYDSFTYNLVHLLLSNRCEVEVIHNDEVTAADVAAFGPDGIVISPGPGTPADAGISVDTVRVCGPAIPLLGICLGHQAIAAAHGARIIYAPQPVHGRASPIVHDGHGVLRGLPQHFGGARYHSLLVDEQTLPACLAVTARTRGRLPMGLRHVKQPTEGIQFHPESILTAHGSTIITAFTQLIRRGEADDTLDRPTGS